MIFIVSKDIKSVKKSDQEEFQEMNLWERQHIEERIMKALKTTFAIRCMRSDYEK